jgi:hypothetical protein
MIISTSSGYVHLGVISPRLRREWRDCRYKIPLGGPRSCRG